MRRITFIRIMGAGKYPERGKNGVILSGGSSPSDKLFREIRREAIRRLSSNKPTYRFIFVSSPHFESV
jgi:hypothetical protein